MSEGEHKEDPGPGRGPTAENKEEAGAYVPCCPALDARVGWIHRLAREGAIDAQTAERHLNAHLVVAGWLRSDPPVRVAAALVMPLTDAPQFGNLPDLWPFVHRALSGPEFRIEPGLQGLILQTLPCFRRPIASLATAGARAPPAAEGDEEARMQDRALLGQGNGPVLINLMLGLLLGLYPDATGKPQFGVRARVFRSLHEALTAGQEAQERFVRERFTLVSLALMEYLSRVIPACMPAEEEFLRQAFAMGQYFEQAPLLCNEFRSGLAGLAAGRGPLTPSEWEEIDARAADTVERTSRVKRKTQRPVEPRKPADEGAPDWRSALGCPAIRAGSHDDYKMLAHSLSLSRHGADVERFHSMIQIGRLPGSLSRMQQEAMSRQTTDWRCAWMRSRMHVCPSCLARRRASVTRHEFRVDTLTGGLACSKCRCPDVMAIDLMGRSMHIAGANYILCPCCCSIHPYHARSEQPWPLACCQPRRTTRRERPPVIKCAICNECVGPPAPCAPRQPPLTPVPQEAPAPAGGAGQPPDGRDGGVRLLRAARPAQAVPGSLRQRQGPPGLAGARAAGGDQGQGARPGPPRRGRLGLYLRNEFRTRPR